MFNLMHGPADLRWECSIRALKPNLISEARLR